jgi:cellulose synthase operon protein C
MNWKFSKSARTALSASLLLILLGCGSADERAKAYYESGVALLEQKEYAKAAVEFRNALKLNKDHADSWFGMAQVEEQSQEWSRVFGDLNKVLEINPKHIKALVALTTLKTLSGDLPGALKLANTAVELEPANPDILSVKASVLLKLGDAPGATEFASQAIALKANHPEASVVLAIAKLGSDPNAALLIVQTALISAPKNINLHLAKLSILEKIDDAPALEAAIRTSSATFPERPEFRTALISFLVKANRVADAEREIRSVFDVDQGNSRAGMELVSFVLQTRGKDAARSELQSIIAAQKDPFQYQLALSELDFNAGRSTESISLLRDLVKQHGISDNGMAARLRLSAQLAATKQIDAAQDVIAEVLENDSQNAEALRQRGSMRIDQGKPDQAIDDLRTAMNLDIKDVKTRMLLALAYERAGQIELAERELAEATKMPSPAPNAGLSYASFLIRRGNDGRAELLLRDLNAQHPSDKNVLLMLADVLTRKQDWQGTADISQQLKDMGEKGVVADAVLAQSLMGQKKFGDAAELFRKVAAQSGNNDQAMTALVRAYVADNKPEEADTFLTSVLDSNPSSTRALILKGALLLRKGQNELAKEKFEQAIAVNPKAPNGYLSLADYHSNQKDLQASVETLTKGIEASSDKVGLRFALAARYETAGAFEDAIMQYDAILVEAPGSLMAINNLASLLTDHRQDADSIARASSMAETLRNSPVPAFRETLGWALVQSGKTKQGLALLERTIPELENIPAAQMHLGMAYAQAGDTELAKVHLKRALELGTSPGMKVKIEGSLKALN